MTTNYSQCSQAGCPSLERGSSLAWGKKDIEYLCILCRRAHLLKSYSFTKRVFHINMYASLNRLWKTGLWRYKQKNLWQEEGSHGFDPVKGSRNGPNQHPLVSAGIPVMHPQPIVLPFPGWTCCTSTQGPEAAGAEAGRQWVTLCTAVTFRSCPAPFAILWPQRPKSDCENRDHYMRKQMLHSQEIPTFVPLIKVEFKALP